MFRLVAILALIILAAVVVTAQDIVPTPRPDPLDSRVTLVPRTTRSTTEATPEATEDLVLVTPLRTGVNIRDGAGTNFAVIHVLLPGQVAEATGYNGFDLDRECSTDFTQDDDMWVRVQIDGEIGWAARCVLQIRGTLAALPDTTLETPEATVDVLPVVTLMGPVSTPTARATVSRGTAATTITPTAAG